jgi:small subunit ribosomal protein S6e
MINMPFKLVIGDKGKSWNLEIQDESLVGKSVGDKVSGKDIKSDFDGYEFEIMGGSDISGFPLSKDVEGIGLKRVLLTKGWGMHDSREGVRLRKTVRGKRIALTTSQINLKVLKHGTKKLAEIFPEQNKAPEAKSEQKAEVKTA